MNKFIYLFIFTFSLSGICIRAQITDGGIEYELKLQEAIETGLKNNPEIKQSLERIEETNGRFWSGISLPAPELSLSYEYIPTGSKLNMFNERTIELSQSFEFPTNYFLYGTSSSKSKNIASHENQLSTLNVRSKIKAAYYKLVWAIDQQQIEQENLALAEEFTNKAEIRLNVGEGTHLESLTAKVEYTEALNNLEKQKNLVLEANAELNYTLGNSQRVITVYKPTDSLNYEELGIDVQNLIDNSSTNNPEILISELSADKASVDKTLAWSGLLPSFRLAYAKQTLEGNNNYYGASFGISIPVWFLFEQRGKIQEASAQANISEYELEQTRSRVLVKIRKAYTQFTNEQKQVRLYRLNLLPQSEEIYSTAYKSYEAGEITYIEFLQAKQILTNTKSNYLQSLLNYNLAIIDLELAAGYELKEWSN